MGEREQVMLGFGEAPKAKQASEEKPESMELRPLAARMRPRSLEEVVGQEGVLGEDKPLRRALKAGRLPSLLLWGPPGCGKTSLAELLAAEAGLRMEKLSAVTAGVKELRELLERVRGPLVLFVDEIHRWNKAQQDGLLAMVEEGRLVLIGATTENPGFQVNPALRSRCWLLKLEALEEEALGRLLERALNDKERGLGRLGLRLGGEAKRKLWALGGGDARRSLGILERAALSMGEGEEIDGVAVEAAAGEPEMGSDRGGEGHYDMASALIKAMRGSDPEASLYWLARLIEGGEDPMFLARRIVIAAAEEVGLADPRVLGTAVDAMVGLERIGMPEGRLLLGMAALSVATAPKSNASYEGINAALAKVKEGGIFPVPLHLRNAPTKLAKELGHGEGYRYPHAEENGFVAQEYLPEGLGVTDFYRPKLMGAEKVIGERMKWWEGLKQKEKGRY